MSETTADFTTPVPGKGWTRSRLITIVALVTAVQVILIFAFGEKKEVVPRNVLNVLTLKFANTTDGQLELLALEDPTLFVLPNAKDFAAAAWLTNHEPEPPSFCWTEPPRWLPFSMDGLGAAFGQLMQTNFPASQPFNFRPVPELNLPTLPEETAPAPNSTMRIRGELAQRQLPSEISLTNWPYADVLAPCVVQVLVDAAGNVVSTVMLKSSSYKNADDKALELTRALRFTSAVNPTFGRIIFNWNTVPPTNESNH
jgi:TonB family protein